MDDSYASAIDVRPTDIMSPLAQTLIAALNAELSAMYPEDGATHFRLDPDEVAPGRGVFVTVHRDGHPIGCGAVRRIDEHTAELKRMYIAPEARSRGISHRLLAALEDEARGLGVTRLVLKTGIRQRAALALYASAGFSAIPAFGEYVDSPLSVCLAKTISAAAPKDDAPR